MYCVCRTALACMCVCESMHVPAFVHIKVYLCLQSFICFGYLKRLGFQHESKISYGEIIASTAAKPGMSETENTMKKWKNILDSKREKKSLEQNFKV